MIASMRNNLDPHNFQVGDRVKVQKSFNEFTTVSAVDGCIGVIVDINSYNFARITIENSPYDDKNKMFMLHVERLMLISKAIGCMKKVSTTKDIFKSGGGLQIDQINRYANTIKRLVVKYIELTETHNNLKEEKVKTEVKLRKQIKTLEEDISYMQNCVSSGYAG